MTHAPVYLEVIKWLAAYLLLLLCLVWAARRASHKDAAALGWEPERLERLKRGSPTREGRSKAIR
jgi:hypothetical protein